MAEKIYFITGGARSGKSAFAEKLATEAPGTRAYLATAQALDEEMVARIERHRKRRGTAWDTFEEPLAVAELVRKLSGRYKILLLDCLTLWLSNVMARTEKDDDVLARADDLLAALRGFAGSVLVVSNEVGLGIVPDNPLARRFRDLAGIMNQRVAVAADEAYLLAAGIPVRIK
jgi:adenosylcobinamide kinase/adenosylcobinamide-phosphate guanylyltransferase